MKFLELHYFAEQDWYVDALPFKSSGDTCLCVNKRIGNFNFGSTKEVCTYTNSLECRSKTLTKYIPSGR